MPHYSNNKKIAPEDMMAMHLYCKTCKKEAMQFIMGAATNGKHPDNVIICGFCESVIAEFDVNAWKDQPGPLDDYPNLQKWMNGEDWEEEE